MKDYRNLLLVGITIAVVVAVSAAAFASGEPDGLERVAEDKGFDELAQEPGYEILPDYTTPGIDNEVLSTTIAGIVGIVVVAALTIGLGKLLQARRRDGTAPPAGDGT